MSGKIHTLSHKDYLAHPAYGSSDIIKMGRSFAFWKWRKTNPEPAGRPLVIGSATHSMLRDAVGGFIFPIDPVDRLILSASTDQIRIYRDGSSKTNGFKAFQAANIDTYCLDAEEYDLCRRMVSAIVDDPEAMSYLKGAIAEPTIIRNYPGTSVSTKCRPDYLHIDRRVSINIKTCADASQSGFFYSAKDFQYDWQSAFYCDLLTEEFQRSFDEVHILVEKTEEGEPPIVRCYTFSDDTIGWARAQVRYILGGIPGCEKTGIWPNQKAKLETLDLPHYMRKVVSE